MLVSVSVPLSYNHSLYLPIIANKFYFDQVISAFLGDLVLAVHIKKMVILISLEHSPLPQSVF